ncbi:hypothetical protein SAMN02745174_02046 [Cetobacterium ceti]|uniref:Uncharacterized protein n=1 Tax=Cetobacterium ceti TaxID=180163 RepID=A0A1T4PU65_9FUSO|nr:hypothetical protein [Cetobacterium ceti]SJZ95090.1 hypothetical protein SAMN02745174_02046 [Cetobacterium ceti]
MAEKQIKEKVEKKQVKEKKECVYIGANIKTPYIVLNRFTILLDKPSNYDQIVEKSKDFAKLLVPIDYFTSNLQQIKSSNYYRDLTRKVQKELGGN